jgi:hypothetical protein
MEVIVRGRFLIHFMCPRFIDTVFCKFYWYVVYVDKVCFVFCSVLETLVFR